MTTETGAKITKNPEWGDKVKFDQGVWLIIEIDPYGLYQYKIAEKATNGLIKWVKANEITLL